MKEIQRAYRFAAFETDPSTFDNTGADTGDIAGQGGAGVTSSGVNAKAGHFGGARTTTTPSTLWSIPANVLADINAAADDRVSGAPVSIIASTMWNLSHNWTRWTPELIAQVAMRLKQGHDQYTGAARPGAEPVDDYTAWLNAATDYGSQSAVGSADWTSYRSTIQSWAQRNFEAGPEADSPTGKFRTPFLPEGLGGQITYGDAGASGGTPSDIQDVYDYFQSFLGRDPTSDAEAEQYVGLSLAALRTVLENTPEGRQWRQYGSQVKSIKTSATQLWRQYKGTDPTGTELVNAVKMGLNTADKMEAYLRSQPYGNTTLGAYSDAKQYAIQYAQQYLGRNPDSDGKELNWLLSQGFTRPEQISAFYEQLKDRVITGDPNFAWAGNPDDWKKTQTEAQGIWAQEGLTGEIDPRVINDAVKGGWTQDQIKTYIEGLQAPNMPTGVTVGEVNRVRSYAAKWKEHYLPGEQLTDAELTKFLNMSSDEVQGYYRSMPLDRHIAALNDAKKIQGQQQTQTGGPTYQNPTGGTDAVPTVTGGVGDVKKPDPNVDPNAPTGSNPQNLRGVPIKKADGTWTYVDPGTGAMR